MRAFLQQTHRWVGLPFALLLLVQGMTGAIMVWRSELTRAIHHSALAGTVRPTSVPVQILLDSVRAVHPGLRVSRIEYSKQPGDALLFRLEKAGEGVERYVAVDPFRGVITRDAALSRWPVQWMFEFHSALWLGAGGKNVVGMNGIALTLLALSGPVLWWRGRRSLRRGPGISFAGGAYRSARDLHRFSGICIAAVLLVSGSTGIVLAWKSTVQPFIGQFMPMIAKPAAKVSLRPGAALRPIDELIAAARSLNGNAPVRNVRFPTGDGREVTIFVADSITGRPRATNQLSFDGYTGEVLGTYTAATLPLGNVLIDWMLPMHSGEVLGAAGRVLFTIAAVVLAVLAATGLWQWFARRQLSRRIADAAVPHQRLRLRVLRTWDETPTVRALELTAVGDPLLPLFTAGAHLDIHLPNGLVRSYSLCGDPQSRSIWQIGVLKSKTSRGGSTAVHELRPGDELYASPPRNRFELVENAPESILIAGGIGITPVLSMVERLTLLGRAFSVHYCVRQRAEAAFVERLSALVPPENLTVHVAGELEPGRFDPVATLSSAPSAAHVYVCGSLRLIEAVESTARSLSWEPSRFHSELFQNTTVTPADRAFDLKLARSGRLLHVSASQTALEVLEEHGVAVASSCQQGLCGTCLLEVLGGIPDHRDSYLTGAEKARNALFTPCCSRAVSPLLVVDA